MYVCVCVCMHVCLCVYLNVCVYVPSVENQTACVFPRKGQSGTATEKYDKTEVKHGDKQCYKFVKRLQIYPQQCIR